MIDPALRYPNRLKLIALLEKLLPPYPNEDIPILYHQSYTSSVKSLSTIILAIEPPEQTPQYLDTSTAIFYHRPFNLSQQFRLENNSIDVFASHKRFDETLTIGYNVHLARNLGLEKSTWQIVQGYKGDPIRRIGIVGKVTPTPIKELEARLRQEFGDLQIISQGDQANIEVICLMNAFGKDEVQRVYEMALDAGFIEAGEYGKLLYVTGEPKAEGTKHLLEECVGMRAICVGHRQSEEWGLKWLAQYMKQTWCDTNVSVILDGVQVRVPSNESNNTVPPQSRLHEYWHKATEGKDETL